MLRNKLFLALLVILALNVGVGKAARNFEQKDPVRVPPKAPVFPKSYEVKYEFILPYVSSVQSKGLKYPVHAWYDGTHGRLRVDVFGGIDSMITLPGIYYGYYPRIYTPTCEAFKRTVGPSRGLGDDGDSLAPLPDIRTWSFAGTARIRGRATNRWQFSYKGGEKVLTYVFFTAAEDDAPVRLQMMGINLLSGSHYDEYLLEFELFRAGPVSESAFDLPKECDHAVPSGGDGEDSPRRRRALRLAGLLPAALAGTGGLSATFATEAAVAGAQRSQEQQEKEHGTVLAENVAFIEAFNAKQAEARRRRSELRATGAAAEVDAEELKKTGFTLAANRFAAMTHEQFKSGFTGYHRRQPDAQMGTDVMLQHRKVNNASSYLGLYKRVLRDEDLPVEVDWRGSGADGVVKDQASCGSCWAFSTAGVLQAAWFLTTGTPLSLSEQQMVDCSWDFGNNGCDGGEMGPAIDYVVNFGGAASEERYPYRGQNMFCSARVSNAVASFRGYEVVPLRDDKALMEAVALRGPVAISFNAGLPPFRYYSEGVYNDPQCISDPDALDHAVLLVGYGTTPAGEDYWLLKNSWSTYWGMDGYVRVARGEHDCGITIQPIVAVVA